MRILVSGASGFLGSALSPALRKAGHNVRALERAETHQNGIRWDVESGAPDGDALREWGGAEAVVHLAGENVGKRWTAETKARIRSSRVEATERLAHSLVKAGTVRVFVGASAIGYYGDRGDEVLTESSANGTGFFAETVKAWELAASPLSEAGVRVAHLRFGMILGNGGALRKMLPFFRLGVGGPLGGGRQWVSWIARRDAVRAIEFLLGNENATGALNAVAPNPVRNCEFSKALGKALHRPAVIPVPAFVLRLLYGEMAEATVLTSQRVLPERLEESGFAFAQPRVEEALRESLREQA